MNLFRISFYLLALIGSTIVYAEDGDAPIRSPDKVEGTTLVDSEAVIELVNNHENLVLIDSRLTTNRSFGFIEGSISLPDTETSCETLARHIPSASTPALFYCNGPKCGRSAIAIKVALECGYSELYWFRGGIEEWRKKGYPLLN